MKLKPVRLAPRSGYPAAESSTAGTMVSGSTPARLPGAQPWRAHRCSGRARDHGACTGPALLRSALVCTRPGGSDAALKRRAPGVPAAAARRQRGRRGQRLRPGQARRGGARHGRSTQLKHTNPSPRPRPRPPHSRSHPSVPPASPFAPRRQALARMMQPFVSWAQKRYQAGLAERLKDYGLRYDDLYDPLMDMVRLLGAESSLDGGRLDGSSLDGSSLDGWGRGGGLLVRGTLLYDPVMSIVRGRGAARECVWGRLLALGCGAARRRTHGHGGVDGGRRVYGWGREQGRAQGSRDPRQTPMPAAPDAPPSPPPPHTHTPQDVAEALRRLPPEVVVARNQRLKRAMDLSMKAEKLPKALREKQTPFDHYLLVGGCGGLGLAWGACLGGRAWLLVG